MGGEVATDLKIMRDNWLGLKLIVLELRSHYKVTSWSEVGWYLNLCEKNVMGSV